MDKKILKNKISNRYKVFFTFVRNQNSRGLQPYIPLPTPMPDLLDQRWTNILAKGPHSKFLSSRDNNF